MDWNEDAPGWEGSDSPIEVLMSDGSIRAGQFYLEDSQWTGEDTIPVWHVEFDDGVKMSFYSDEIKGWRKKGVD